MSGEDSRGDGKGGGGPSDRRSKTLYDYVNSAGSVGGLSVGGVILMLVLQQSNLSESQGHLIEQNTKSSEKVSLLLQSMRSEFKIDIHTFKINHKNLEGKLVQYDSDQRQVLMRLAEIERLTEDVGRWGEIEARLKSWAESRFAGKGQSGER